MKMNLCFNMRFFTSILFLAVSVNVLAEGGAVQIPLKTLSKPASDLRLDNKNLSFGDISTMFQNRFDLSKVNPIENKYWQNTKYPAVDPLLDKNMPDVNSKISIESVIGSVRELGLFSIVVKTSDQRRYTLAIGQQIHSSLLKAALLRKLGYFQESPKYYSKIKIDFTSIENKQNFINSAFCQGPIDQSSLDCLSISPFKTADNDKEYLSQSSPESLSLFLHGVYLEKLNPEVPSLFDGLTPGGLPSLLEYLSTSRAFRSLVVPFVIGDMGESVNRVSSQAVFIRNGVANINYGFDYYFGNTDTHDVRWMLRRVGQLTDQDWTEIVDASMYPPALKQLVKAKIMSRAKNYIDSFFEKDERVGLFNATVPSTNYSSTDGYVVNGKVVVQNIPNYPQRFSHGDRQSPFESGDFLKFMKVKLISSAIEIGTINLQKIIGAEKTFTLDEQKKGIEVSRQGVRVIGNTTGMIGGINYGTSRILTTGTFFGSQAPIQLVDTVSTGARIGFMRSANELGGFAVNGGVQVSYNREFTHVRPLNSIKESGNVSWFDTQVDIKLSKLGKVLNPAQTKPNSTSADLSAITDPVTNANTTENPPAPVKTIDGFVSFINEMRSGEVFLITDSITGAAQAGVNVGLDSLIGFYAGTLSPTIGLTAGGAKVLLRQIQITKTNDGLQIFVRDQNTKAFSLEFSLNYFVNLMKIKGETINTDLHTDAFILNYNSDLVAKGDSGEIDLSQNPDIETLFKQQKAFGQKLASALRGLIYQSSTDQLYTFFKYQQFQIDHKLITKNIKTKIFWYRASKMQESHLLTIQKPELNTPQGVQVVNEPIQIISHRKGALKGRDLLGFGLDLVDGTTALYLKNYSPTLNQESQNPTQVPFGKAEWRIVKTESEVNQERFGALPTISTVEHVWGGWSIPRNKLDSILENVKLNIKGTEYDGQELIPANVLQNVKKMNFFRVTSHLSLLPPAVEKIRDLVIAPTDATNKANIKDSSKGLAKFFKKLFKPEDARLEDTLVYNNLLMLMGGGDSNLGRQLYLSQCQVNRENSYQYSTYKGTAFECLEPWVEKIMDISRKYYADNSDIKMQNEMMNEIIYLIEEKIPLNMFLSFLEKPNYIYYIDISGFRTGDENADDGDYLSNTLGEPEKRKQYSNGLIGVVAEKSNIISTELNRTGADFQ